LLSFNSFAKRDWRKSSVVLIATHLLCLGTFKAAHAKLKQRKGRRQPKRSELRNLPPSQLFHLYFMVETNQ